MGPSGHLRNPRVSGAICEDARHLPLLGAQALVPGLTQIQCHQRDRGLVFLVSFLAALGTSLFCWGKPLGWALLGFAFLTHATASLDVLRQRAFPVFPTKIAASAMMIVMVLVVYLPLAAALLFYALPTRDAGESGTGYLVNCLAYQRQEPLPGQWIWLRLPPGRNGCAGRVVATAGQEVEWTGRRWRVDGKDLQSARPNIVSVYPEGWRFRVPEHHFLVGSEPTPLDAEPLSPLVIVSRDQIVGRAWAKYYPLWERSLL